MQSDVFSAVSPVLPSVSWKWDLDGQSAQVFRRMAFTAEGQILPRPNSASFEENRLLLHHLSRITANGGHSIDRRPPEQLLALHCPSFTMQLIFTVSSWRWLDMILSLLSLAE